MLDTAKSMHLTRLCKQINNIVFFFIYTHNKLIKKFNANNMSTLNRKDALFME